ncbi:MAG TPA: PQQ-binding-like beta-propeller repeat protein [Vicinamibacterales bacterium]|jgi:outer membrane protein assembly factor BamB|nr:PQQ-binding-like beta-propeller repeat protein [Vicinamibacterales bacterium]
MRTSLFASGLLLTVTTLHAAGDWTQWGGPQRNFMSDSRGLVSSWPADGPKRIWTRSLGEGHSAILIDGTRLYTMYRPLGMMSMVRRSQEEVIICADATSGKTIWEHRYPAPTAGLDLEYGAGPHSTPLIVGNRLFAAGSLKELLALDKQSGKVLWSHDLMKEFGAPKPGRGFSPSPIAYRETVIIPSGGPSGVMAFDQATGKVVWKSPSFEESPASPILINLEGEEQLVIFGGAEIVGMNPTSGAILWRHPHKTDWGLNISTPVWGKDNVLFLSSAYSAGTRSLQLSKTGPKTNVKELFFTNRMRVHIGTVIRIGDYAYGASGDFGPAFITAINVKSGQEAWRDRSFARSTFLYADGKLIILDEDGTLGLATISPQGIKVLTRAEIMTKTSWTVPTLVGTRLYVRDRKDMLALELGS